MTLSGWENWGMKIYWIPVLIIVFILGLIVYLVEKQLGEMPLQKKKKHLGKSK